MGEKMTALKEINALVVSFQLPTWVLQDIRIRIGDHMTSGGGADDAYIHQQLRFVKNVIRSAEQDAATNNL